MIDHFGADLVTLAVLVVLLVDTLKTEITAKRLKNIWLSTPLSQVFSLFHS